MPLRTLFTPPLACWNEVEIPLTGSKRSEDPDVGAR